MIVTRGYGLGGSGSLVLAGFGAGGGGSGDVEEAIRASNQSLIVIDRRADTSPLSSIDMLVELDDVSVSGIVLDSYSGSVVDVEVTSTNVEESSIETFSLMETIEIINESPSTTFVDENLSYGSIEDPDSTIESEVTHRDSTSRDGGTIGGRSHKEEEDHRDSSGEID